MNHLETLDLFFDAMPGGSDPNEPIVTRVSIRNSSSATAPTSLEADRELAGAMVTGREEDHRRDRRGKRCD